jgi:YggT family protein
VQTLASFVNALSYVYLLMIIAYVVLGMLPLPYNRILAAVRDFLEQTVSPYLSLFRRFIPPLGPIDISPMIAIFVLVAATRIVVSLILR